MRHVERVEVLACEEARASNGVGGRTHRAQHVGGRPCGRGLVECTKLLQPRKRAIREDLFGARHDRAVRTLEDGLEDVLFALEVMVDGALGEAIEPRHDVRHRRVFVAALGEKPLGHVEDLLDRFLRVLVPRHGHPLSLAKHTMSMYWEQGRLSSYANISPKRGSSPVSSRHSGDDTRSAIAFRMRALASSA